MKICPLRVSVSSLIFAACGEQLPEPNEPALPLSLSSIGPSSIIPGTTIDIAGSGIPTPEIADLSVTLRGSVRDQGGGGRSAVLTLPVEFRDRANVRVRIDAATVSALGEGLFTGQASLQAAYLRGPTLTSTIDYTTTVARTLRPAFRALSPSAIYLGTVIDIEGSGFIHAAEGETVLRWTGAFKADTATIARTVGERLVRPSFVSRERLRYTVDAELFGIAPGAFTGSFIIENRHAAAGGTIASAPIPVASLVMAAPMLIDITPGAASRGQRVHFRGRGFLPTDGARDQTTVVEFVGSFRPKDGATPFTYRADAPYLFMPRYVDGSTLELVPWASVNDRGALEGLATQPGTWDGSFTPVVIRGNATQTGTALRAQFRILNAKQVVYLKYLPGFTDSLRKFGLRNVEVEVRSRIIEVARRDYARWNVEFREERPTDFVEYAVVEVGGKDPNGRNMFGLDNTEGKDLGNLRLNDVVGGRNADTEEGGSAAFGGVFIESFLQFSTAIADPISIADPLFDRIFNPLREDRGGIAADRSEFPVGARADAIGLAVRTLGNLVGTTVSHEIGHTLGMAIIEGYYHNPLPGPNQLMDSGEERPFKERAELSGFGPATFEPNHVTYLDQILGRD